MMLMWMLKVQQDAAEFQQHLEHDHVCLKQERMRHEARNNGAATTDSAVQALTQLLIAALI
jgi:hypothetical protein